MVGFFAMTSTRKVGRPAVVLIAAGREIASWMRSSETGQLTVSGGACDGELCSAGG